MFMGRILKILVLAVTFFAAGFFCLPGISSAADVWCHSLDGRSFYLISESINAKNLPTGMDYRVVVKTVRDSDGALEKTVIYGYEMQNDIMVGAFYNKSSELWDTVPEGEGPVLKAVWEAMKPCMDQKRIGYSDTWKWK